MTDKGDRIEGHFQNHTVKLRMTLSITIVGSFFQVNGRAVWSWPEEGSRMEGSFKRGFAHGPGVLYFSDGSRFSYNLYLYYKDGFS